MFSLGASFAVSDDNASAVAVEDNVDEIAIDEKVINDEKLNVEEDSPIVTAGEHAVVTNNTFKEYFNENGTLRGNVTAEELEFQGNFADVGVDTISLNRTIKISGDGVLNNISIDVKAKDVVISGITFNQTKGVAAINVYNASGVTIENAKINFNANAGSDGFAIKADLADNLKLLNNAISYAGATTGWEVNNAVRVSNSNNTEIKGNKIKAKLVSSAVGWAEVPPGSENYVSSPISEGIVIVDSENVTFDDNELNVTYSTVVGAYDTIYSVDFKNVTNAVVSNNVIDSVGNTYIYGIILTGDNFTIEHNNITSTGNYYANGIDIEGPAVGVVQSNNIAVKSPVSAYAIYSGMNGANVTAKYIENNISGKAYNIFGMSIGDVNATIFKNSIDIDGNYSTGIAYRGSSLHATENRIILSSSEIGDEDIWEGFGVEAVGIKVIQGVAIIDGNTIATPGKGISLKDATVLAYLHDNFINVVANFDKDAYAVYAVEVPELSMSENHIDYQGSTNGTGVNNAVYIFDSPKAVILENKFDLDLVSSYVPWDAYWVPHPKSEGVVVEKSYGVKFLGNNVTVSYGDVVGAYDTIYSVDFKNCNNAEIIGNNINSTGNSYIYGIVLSGQNFTISNNNITSNGSYYANGIDIEGPATGKIEENTVVATANTTAYPVYGAMSNGEVSVYIKDNVINGSAYLVYGIQLGGEKVIIENNEINAEGNYTIGIGVHVDEIIIEDNNITSKASNVGNQTVWETMGTNTEGILIKSGDAVINGNNVNTTGNNTINTGDNAAIVKDNNLTANGTSGNATIKGDNVVESTLNTVLVGSDLTKVYGDKDQYAVTVLDQNGKPIAGKVVTVVVGNATLQAITDASGVARFDIDFDAGNYTVKASINSTVVYNSNSTSNTVVITKKPTVFTANGVTLLVTATKSGSNYKIVLKDNSGNALASKNVKITFNGKTSTVSTNANGEITYKLVAAKAGNYKLNVVFDGDNNYAASSASATIKVNKEASKLTAKKKTFKAKVKTKKYAVTLKDSKGKAIKKVKVTLKVKGKTYKATTNAKGKATFKIKNLKKKGKYTATVKFAGNTLYKASTKKVKITVKK